MLKHLYLENLNDVSTLQSPWAIYPRALLYFCFESFFPNSHPNSSILFFLSDSQQIWKVSHCTLLQEPFTNGKLLPHLSSAFHFHELIDPFPPISP